MYGPTETTIWSSVHRVIADGQAPVVELGHPIANTQFYVLTNSAVGSTRRPASCISLAMASLVATTIGPHSLTKSLFLILLRKNQEHACTALVIAFAA